MLVIKLLGVGHRVVDVKNVSICDQFEKLLMVSQCALICHIYVAWLTKLFSVFDVNNESILFLYENDMKDIFNNRCLNKNK